MELTPKVLLFVEPREILFLHKQVLEYKLSHASLVAWSSKTPDCVVFLSRSSQKAWVQDGFTKKEQGENKKLNKNVV